mgnify:CR=1 FL=1
MIIKILGTGCARCKQLAINTQQAVDEMGVEATIEKVEKIDEIIEYGVMKPPALVVNDQVKVSGRVQSAEDIKKYLQ